MQNNERVSHLGNERTIRPVEGTSGKLAPTVYLRTEK
jgi:hypothetical protein